MQPFGNVFGKLISLLSANNVNIQNPFTTIHKNNSEWVCQLERDFSNVSDRSPFLNVLDRYLTFLSVQRSFASNVPHRF